jgi:glycolate oxidase
MNERALLELSRRLASDMIATDADVCAAYAKDESEAEPVVPDAVVRVRSTADVSAVLEIAASRRVPVTPRAAGTSRTGSAVPSPGGWVLSFERFERILEIHEGDGVAVVEPGVITGALHRAVEERGLFYAPDPNSLEACTIGGNIAANAGGPRAVKYGVTRDWVLGLEVVVPGGNVLELGRRTRKGVTGYDLTSLMVGSEGTLAVVTRATLRLAPCPESVRTILALLPDEAEIGRALRALSRARIVPRCAELLDAQTLEVLREAKTIPIHEAARALLLVEIDGDESAMDAALERAGAALEEANAIELLVAKHEGDRERFWSVRREMSRALRRRARHKLSEDVAVPPSRLGDLLAFCRVLGERHAISIAAYGHAGDGNLHVNFLWNEDVERARVDAAIVELFREVVAMKGTLSGEHGIGLLKAPYLPIEQKPELIALQERLKALFDPTSILNPGKIFPARGHGAC